MQSAPRGAHVVARLLARGQSTVAALRPPIAYVVSHFDDAHIAYKSKSVTELVRALAVFELCAVRPLVSNSQQLLNLSTAIAGRGFTHWMLRQSFFGHFCAGESAADIRPTLEQLRRAGVGAILDYAAEADVKPGQRAVAADVDAATADGHVDIFLSCINSAAERPNGFAAVKATALCKPEVLKTVSGAIVAARGLFEAIAKAAGATDGMLSYAQFAGGARALGCDADDATLQRVFTSMGPMQDGAITAADFEDVAPFDGECARVLFALPRYKTITPLSAAEVRAFGDATARMDKLAQAASAKAVRLMVDAEQTYMQHAIDLIVVRMQRAYNRSGFPTVYNTYQAYLRRTEAHAKDDLALARRKGFILAAKVVRGAYMNQERDEAAKKGYADPIHPDIEHTHAAYHAVVDMLLDNKKTTDFMVASHNEKSVLHTVRGMQQRGIGSSDGVFFGQLLGMCDHVTYTLAEGGFASYKYVPYGPIDEVIPYLIRRALENGSVMSGAKKESQLIVSELRRRVFS